MSNHESVRYDIYRLVHKALRVRMGETLAAVGRLDPHDAAEVYAVLSDVDDLLAMCRTHLECENGFVHPALERARAGGAAETAAEHRHHEQAISDLETSVVEFGRSEGPSRGHAAHRLYLKLSCFVADNLHHMQREEEENNRLLWQSYSDAQLQAVEQAIADHLTPAQKMAAVGWMVPAMNPAERVGFLAKLRDTLPPPVFAAVLDMIRTHLSDSAWHDLARALPLNDDQGETPLLRTAVVA
jgi:hypothetical protein